VSWRPEQGMFASRRRLRVVSREGRKQTFQA
jgi:hypothetical protein